MTVNKNNLIVTADGSHSLYNSLIDEHYHSIHGSIQESKHIFIDAGLKSIEKKEINILEIGFGTGLNALLTYIEAKKSDLYINYSAIEKFPIPENIFKKLNFAELSDTGFNEFLMMHNCIWNNEVKIDGNFTFEKILCDVRDATFQKCFDLVYFDLFSQKKQPELWTNQVIENILQTIKPNGVFVTYSANGMLKRILETAGFQVFHLSGPPGKRVFTKAVKKI